MKMELRSLICSDADIENLVVPDGQAFRFYVEAEIGVLGEDGADLFGFTICNSEWLRANSTDFMPLHTFFLMNEFDFKLLWQSLLEFLARFEGDNWEDLCGALSRFTIWEFEGL